MKIYLLNGADPGRSFELDKDTIKLGRELDNDISLATGGVSRYHAMLQRTDKGVWLVSDLGSTNGTKINGKLIEDQRALEEGDVISLGDQNIRFGKKKDLAKDVAEVLRNTAELEDTIPRVVFHSAPPEPVEAPIKPVISIKSPHEATTTLETREEAPALEKTDLSIFENKDLNLFQKKKKTPEAKNGLEKKSRRLSSTLLFYTAIVGLIAIFAAGFHAFNKDDGKKPENSGEDKSEAKAPFVLSYVKENVNGDNIFRFSLDITGRKAVFCIDDLKSRRHYVKTEDKVLPAYLETLQKEIRNTDFFALEPEHIGASTSTASNERRLLIADSYKMNNVLVRNTYAPNSFESIAQAIDTFAAHYNLHTIAMTVDEIIKIAQQDFNNAEDLFRNRDANSGNILKAISLYKLVVENLDPFQPKPEIWDRARKREQEAESIRQKLIADLNFELTRRSRLKDYEGARDAVVELMKLLSEDGKGYKQAIDLKLDLDRRIREQRKR